MSSSGCPPARLPTRPVQAQPACDFFFYPTVLAGRTDRHPAKTTLAPESTTTTTMTTIDWRRKKNNKIGKVTKAWRVAGQVQLYSI